MAHRRSALPRFSSGSSLSGFAFESGAPRGAGSSLENNRHFSSISLGSRIIRRIHFSGCSTAMGGRVDAPHPAGLAGPNGRACPHLHHFWDGTPLVSRLPQLEMGPASGHPRMVLRPRAQSGRQHPGRSSNPCPSGGHLAGVFCVTSRPEV